MYGFEVGGLIVDAGKNPDGQHSRLARRVGLPPNWRFVLISPPDVRGLAGDREVEAFARLSPVPESVTEQLWKITNSEMLPAVEASDCAAFGHAVYRFGRLAGDCFAAVQGGSFASPRIAELVAALREFDVSGVGQSSWGPTVFAVVSDCDEAERLVHWLQSRNIGRRCEISIAQPNNTGAVFGP
jgi:beta-RFAP synthase